jgi:hypothetical protein
MDSTNIIEILKHTIRQLLELLPTFLFDSHFKINKTPDAGCCKDHQAPLASLQAYERMTLFMERINPSQLMVRIVPLSENKTTIKIL